MTAVVVLAFATGMVAPVNPCGFALLPAYLAYQPAAIDAGTGRAGGRLVAGLRAGLSVTAGFAAVFIVAGVALTLGLRALLGIAPWLGLAVGTVLAAAGVWMLAGRRLAVPRLPGLPLPAAGRGSGGGMGRLVVFGTAYATASLSCTLGILLAVIAQALATGSLAGLVAVFAAYTLGAATVLILVATGTAVAGGAVTGRLRRLAPLVPRIAGGVLVLAGAYLIAYWAPVAATGSPAASPLASTVSTLSGRFTNWITAHQSLLAFAALTVVAAAAVTAATTRVRRRRQPATAELGSRGSPVGDAAADGTALPLASGGQTGADAGACPGCPPASGSSEGTGHHATVGQSGEAQA